MGSAYLPVDRSWENYIRDADDTYEDLEKEMKCSLMKLADETCNYLHGKRFARFLTLIYFFKKLCQHFNYFLPSKLFKTYLKVFWKGLKKCLN